MSERERVLAEMRHHLDEMVAAGKQRLAPERMLCERFGVSRATLRLVLATLEAEGLLWRHVGQGTFVGQRPVASNGQLELLGAQINPLEIMEARLAIEPSIAALAAVRASQNDVLDMRECLRKARATTDVAVFELWDGVLHATIARSTRNELLRTILDALNTVRERTEWGQLKQATLSKERLRLHWLQHCKIVDAIGERDVERAALEMRTHLETVREHIAEHRAGGEARSALDAGHRPHSRKSGSRSVPA